MAENEIESEELRDKLLRGIVIPEALALSLTTSTLTFIQLLKVLRGATSDALVTEKQFEALVLTVDLMVAIGSRLIVYDAESQRFLPGSAAEQSTAGAQATPTKPVIESASADVLDWLHRQMAASASGEPGTPGHREGQGES